MKKKIRLLGILILALMLALAGCTGGDDDDGGSRKKSRKERQKEKEEEEEEEEDEDEEEEEEDEEAELEKTLSDDALLSVLFEDHQITVETKSGDELAYGNAHLVMLSEEDAQKAPKLAERLDRKNKSVESELDETVAGLADSATESWADGMMQLSQTHQENIELLRADGKALCYCRQISDFYGGAHGISGWICTNLDTKTGNDIAFSDVVSDPSGLPQIIFDELVGQNPELKDFLQDEYEADFMASLEERLADDADMLEWGLAYDGMLVCFEDYALGSYAAGAWQVKIPFADHPDVFTDTYVRDDAPDAAAQVKELDAVARTDQVEGPATGSVTYFEFDENGKAGVKIDLDGDGTEESAAFTAAKDKDTDCFRSLTMTSGQGESTVEDLYAYYLQGFWVVTGSGNQYLYLQQLEENDYRTLAVCSYENGRLRYVDTTTGAVGFTVWNADDTYETVVMQSPQSFLVECVEQRMGTLHYTMECRVGSDGMPEETGAFRYYTLAPDFTFAALQDIKAVTVSEGGVELGEGVIPKGTGVHPYRTTGEDWIDVQAGDEIFRLTFEKPAKGDWCETVGGVRVIDLFEDIVFAG